MRKLLPLLFLLPFFGYGQTVAPGEYDCYFINSSGKLYDLMLAMPTAMNVPSTLTWKYVAGGLHNGAAVDNNSHCWTAGDNSGGVAGNGSLSGTSAPSQVLTDSSGKVFDNVAQVALWYSTGTGVLAVKGDGSLWIWGNLAGNMRGNGTSTGTWTRPVQVIIPGSRKVTKVVVNNVVVALCSDGTVWAWGGTTPDVLGTNNADCSHPHQVILPQTAKDIAGGCMWSYAVGSNGTLYGWGWYTNAFFGSFSGAAIPTPIDLTKYMNFPLPVSKAYVNTIASYFILSDSSLWSCGDNIDGTLGNGKQLDQATAAYPYATWPDPSAPGQLLQPIPTKILAGTKFVNVFVGTADVFYFYAQDSKGQLYSAGRNKGGVLGNGVRECDYLYGQIGAALPNSWNVPLLTAVNPLSIKTAISQTSPYCLVAANASTSPCNACAIQPNGQPIPGIIQAESYVGMSGVQSQNTTDGGGGLNVGWIDLGDWMDYDVNAATAGTYTVGFRVATPYTGTSFQLRAEDGTVLATVKPANSGGFQTWETVVSTITLPAGFQTLRLYSTTTSRWNINYMQFVSGVATSQATTASSHILSMDTAATASLAPASFTLYPNPVKDAFVVQLNNGYTGNMTVQIVDASGATRHFYKFNKDQSAILVNLSANDLPAGSYFVRVQIGTWSETKKMAKF